MNNRVGCSFGQSHWGILRFPEVTVTPEGDARRVKYSTKTKKEKSKRQRLVVPPVTTRSRSEGSVASYPEDPFFATGRSETHGGILNLGLSLSMAPPQRSAGASGSRDIVVALDSFSFVDAALQDPDRTSTTLANAAIRLQIAMSNDEGASSTLSMVVSERRLAMEKLLRRVRREADRFDDDALADEDRVGDEGNVSMEEPAEPVVDESGSREGKGPEDGEDTVE